MTEFSKDKKWQSSKPQLLFLSKFLSLRSMDEFSNSEVWAEVLKENPKNSIRLFLDEGFLRKGDLKEKMDANFKVADLKILLKERNLPQTGKKSILIEKLVRSDRPGMEILVKNFDMIICTDTGRSIVEEYLKKEEWIKDAVEKKVILLLRGGMFRDACISVANYEAEQVFQRGIGIDWRTYNPNRDESILKTIFTKTPKMLSSLDKEQIDALRLAAGMMELWGTNSGKEWLPDNISISLKIGVDSAVRMLNFHAIFLDNKMRFKESGIELVEILSTDTSCESCKKHAGKIFKIDDVIELPNPECTHEFGCRCCIGPRFR